MVLVDTSVWVEVFRRNSRLELGSLVDLDEVVTCPPVAQEVLQGFRDERAFSTARAAMIALPMVEAPMSWEVFAEAVAIYRSARRLGLTVRSNVDCLIAVCAIRNSVEVLHCDRDFDAIARVSPLRSRRIER